MRSQGRLTVITGCMFAGKTAELIRRLRRASFARIRFQAFKARIDDRYHATDIVSHDASTLAAVAVADADELRGHLLEAADIIGIDEAQFFDVGLVPIVQSLIGPSARHVIVAGLDMRADGQPFGAMPQLLAIANEVVKLTAICTACGADACLTQRIAPVTASAVGGIDKYEARCRRCWTPVFVAP